MAATWRRFPGHRRPLWGWGGSGGPGRRGSDPEKALSTPIPPAARDDADLVRAFLATRDVACPGCGYNLRGLAGTRCPECERPVTLGVSAWGGARHRRRAAVLMGLILAAIGVQLVIWVLGVGLAAGLPDWMRLGTFVLLGVMAVEGAVLARLIAALRRGRESAVGWGMCWLGVHAVVMWASVAFNLLVL